MNFVSKSKWRDIFASLTVLFLVWGASAPPFAAGDDESDPKPATTAIAARTGGRPKASPLPKPITVRIKGVATGDDAIEQLFVSDANPMSLPGNRMVTPNTNLIRLDAKQLSDLRSRSGGYARLKGVPNSKIHVLIDRYEEGAAEVVDELIALARDGYGSVTLMTDANVSMKGSANPLDFSQYVPIEGQPNGDALKRLIQAGKFVVANGHPDAKNLKYKIVVSPLVYADMKPIMHQKDEFIYVEGVGGRYDIGETADMVLYNNSSGNHTERPRMNFTVFFKLKEIIANALAHSLSMVETLESGKQISDIPTPPRYRFEFDDGTFIEEMWTDGKLNPNDRIDELLALAVTDPDHMQILEIVTGEFAWTKATTLQAIRDAMEKGQRKLRPNADPFRLFLVEDEHFGSTVTYGVSSAVGGYDIARPHGPPVYGFPAALRARVDGYMWQKVADENGEMDPDGAPITTHVYHIKTFTVRTLEKGDDGKVVEYIHVFNGSWNLSNHAANADNQVWFKLRADSPFANAVVDAIKASTQGDGKQYAIPIVAAEFRMLIANLIGKSWQDISVANTNRMVGALHDGNNAEFESLVRGEISSPENHLIKKKRVSSGESQARLTKVMAFLKWYQDLDVKERDGKDALSPQRVGAVLHVLGYPDHSAFELKQRLSSVLWRPGLEKPAIEALTRRAWTELQIDKPFPVFDPDKGASGAVPAPASRREENLISAKSPVHFIRTGSDGHASDHCPSYLKPRVEAT